MAEINTNSGEALNGKGSRRAKRLSTKIDLTPMVDLGFLLITFFILTKELQEPKSMTLLLPAPGTGTEAGESTVLTVIPIDEQRIFFYHGDFARSVETNAYGITAYDEKTGIGKLINDKKLSMASSKKVKVEDFILIIKPTQQSKLGNIVNVLDEVRIYDLKHYAFVDIDPIEEKFLKSKKILQ